MLVDPSTGELRFEAATNMEEIMLGIVIPVEGSIAGWIVTHSEPVVVPDTSEDSRWSQKVDQQTSFVTRSILGVPLVTRDKSIGALEALNKRAGDVQPGRRDHPANLWPRKPPSPSSTHASSPSPTRSPRWCTSCARRSTR